MLISAHLLPHSGPVVISTAEAEPLTLDWRPEEAGVPLFSPALSHTLTVKSDSYSLGMT